MIYIHSNKPQIIHRDLKSLNILLSQEIINATSFIHTKITDFGISKKISNEQQFMTRAVGSYHWMAPELLDYTNYDEKVDVWSFGIIIYELIWEKIPYDNLDNLSLADLLKSKKYTIKVTNFRDDIELKLFMLIKECIN